MRKRKIMKNIHWLGAVDWDRRLFDSLIPIPDGTTYNTYLIEGSEKTASSSAVISTVPISPPPTFSSRISAAFTRQPSATLPRS